MYFSKHSLKFKVGLCDNFVTVITSKYAMQHWKLLKSILVRLDASKAPGLDKISSKTSKDGREVLALILCNLINL